MNQVEPASHSAASQLVGVSLVGFHTEVELMARVSATLLPFSDSLCGVEVLLNEDTTGELARMKAGLGPLGLPGLRVVSDERNLGYAGGHNRNAAELFRRGAGFVLVLNPDVLLAAGALDIMCAAARSEHGRSLVGPLLELSDSAGRPEGRIDSAGIFWTSSGRHFDSLQGRSVVGLPALEERVAGISGACMLVPREAYEVLLRLSGELFDEDFIAYREDAELAFRAAMLGVPSRLCPQARALHTRTQRGSVRGRDEHIDMLGVRNRFLLAFKYGRRRPGRLLAALCRDLVVLAAVVLRERSSWPGVRDAWALRRRMRLKGNLVLAHAVIDARAACQLAK